jgi:opacity protein-like surface antigen
MRPYKKLPLLLSLLFFPYCFTTSAYSTQTWPNDSLQPYGNSQTKSFRDAMQGGTAIPEHAEQIIQAQTEKDKFYVRLGISNSRFSVDSFKNQSGSTDSTPPLTIEKMSFTKKVSNSRQGLEAAFGYIWSTNVRSEVELLVNRRTQFFTYSAIQPIVPFSFNVRNKTILANLFYEYPLIERFCPFISVGLGATQIRINNISPATLAVSALGTPAPRYTLASKNVTSLAYTAGLGVRVKFFSSWNIAGGYRLLSLSKLKLTATATSTASVPTQKLNAKYNQSAFSIAVMYLF